MNVLPVHTLPVNALALVEKTLDAAVSAPLQ
jgi:hypothetical protein